MSFEHISPVVALYFVFYGVTAMAALIAAVYLLWCRGNAFAADITPPVRLRHWAASFFAATVLSHVWWFIFYSSSYTILSAAHVLMAGFDCVTLMITIAGTLLAMLQDRKRPVWPVFVGMVPFVALCMLLLVSPSVMLLRIAIIYMLSVYALFTVYMVFASRQYGRWLRDNYADLENKMVWLSQVVIIGIMLMFILYAFDDGNVFTSYITAATELVFFVLLLWRVETLPQLVDMSSEQEKTIPVSEKSPHKGTDIQTESATLLTPTINCSNIEQLLAEHCVATQLYLQHDLTLLQLAKAIGSNRTYLGQFFSSQGTTYNAYINDLRIRHFVHCYHEAVKNNRPVTAQQLAKESGYRSYSTFSLAFKQRMGQSVTVWMRDVDR